MVRSLTFSLGKGNIPITLDYTAIPRKNATVKQAQPQGSRSGSGRRAFSSGSKAKVQTSELSAENTMPVGAAALFER